MGEARTRAKDKKETGTAAASAQALLRTRSVCSTPIWGANSPTIARNSQRPTLTNAMMTRGSAMVQWWCSHPQGIKTCARAWKRLKPLRTD